jgi:signal transduction histidine kinase
LSKFEKFSLRDNPFGIVPVPGVEVWADRAQLKAETDRLIKNILISTPSRLAACFHGDWGAGKTHMASYFSRQDLLKKYASEAGVDEPLSLSLLMPPREIVDSIYFGILDLVQVARIKKAVNALLPPKVLASLEESVQRLQPIVQDRNLSIALLAREALLQAFLYETATAKELRQLGIPRGISTDSDKLRALRAVLNLLTKSYSRIILWLDDVERISALTSRDLFDFQVFMRDILDYVPNNLNIILLFTLSPGEDVEDMISYLGDALRSRLYDVIRVEDVTKDDLIQYVTDLLAYYRMRGARKPVDQYYPFKGRAVLEHVYQKMQQKDVELKRKRKGGRAGASFACTPRNINRVFSQLLELGLNDPKIETIDSGLVDAVMSKL